MSSTAIRFTNFSSEDFVGMWDNVEYPFKAGESKNLPGYLAEHFAKHLVDREMQKVLTESNMTSMNDAIARKPFLDKCLSSVQEFQNDLQAEIAALNEPTIKEEIKDLNPAPSQPQSAVEQTAPTDQTTEQTQPTSSDNSDII